MVIFHNLSFQRVQGGAPPVLRSWLTIPVTSLICLPGQSKREIRAMWPQLRYRKRGHPHCMMIRPEFLPSGNLTELLMSL